MVRNTLILRKLQQALPLLFFLLIAAKSLLILPACKPGNMAVDANADTTSHNFVFQIDTLGDGNSSLLNDVCIIDENNIWAVGQIHLKDALGNFTPPYNIARWDGNKWSLQRLALPQYNFDCTIAFFSSALATAVYGFSPATVILTDGASVLKWSGSQISHYPCIPLPMLGDGRIVKLWGTSENSFYAVGTKGIIFYYNGSSWQKLASGTTVDIQDIWGAVDGKTGQTTILAIASFINYGRGLDLLQIQGTTASKLDTAGLRIAQSSVWFTPGQSVYVVGDGLFSKSKFTDARWQLDGTQPSIYKRRIRGNSWNDFFIAGDFGLLSHYNGMTWKHYQGEKFPSFFGLWSSVAVNGNMIVAVGEINDQAIGLRGKR